RLFPHFLNSVFIAEPLFLIPCIYRCRYTMSNPTVSRSEARGLTEDDLRLNPEALSQVARARRFGVLCVMLRCPRPVEPHVMSPAPRFASSRVPPRAGSAREPARRRNEPIPPPAQAQSRGLVAVETAGARRSQAHRQADPALGGLRGLPLVSRDGAREF